MHFLISLQTLLLCAFSARSTIIEQ